MLPGNLQYWEPSKFSYKIGTDSIGIDMGTKVMDINEPIHFCGPSPGEQSAIAEEEKKEE